MSLSLWKNGYKKADNQPDYVLNKWDGAKSTNVGGGWIKDAKNGEQYISVSYNDEYKGGDSGNQDNSGDGQSKSDEKSGSKF